MLLLPSVLLSHFKKSQCYIVKSRRYCIIHTLPPAPYVFLMHKIMPTSKAQVPKPWPVGNLHPANSQKVAHAAQGLNI